MTFDCAQLFVTQDEATYCHEYERYLDFFKMLSHSQIVIECENAPNCWSPLISYLGHSTTNRIVRWSLDRIKWDEAGEIDDIRRLVEVSSTCRPELVHALFLVDTEWPNFLTAHKIQDSFYVTCNGSFYRPEIQLYREQLHNYEPEKQCAILLPCAAQKPYPAPLHAAVKKLLSNDHLEEQWELIIATGVLGLVPEGLWGVMPLYDSGLPYQHRVTSTVSWYFAKHRYHRVIVYSDFYAEAIMRGFDEVRGSVPNPTYMFGEHYRTSYSNLMLEEHLMTLEAEIRA